jgi:hypothetical protein
MNENDFTYESINHANKFQTTIRKNLKKNSHILLQSKMEMHKPQPNTTVI